MARTNPSNYGYRPPTTKRRPDVKWALFTGGPANSDMFVGSAGIPAVVRPATTR